MVVTYLPIFPSPKLCYPTPLPFFTFANITELTHFWICTIAPMTRLLVLQVCHIRMTLHDPMPTRTLEEVTSRLTFPRGSTFLCHKYF